MPRLRQGHNVNFFSFHGHGKKRSRRPLWHGRQSKTNRHDFFSKQSYFLFVNDLCTYFSQFAHKKSLYAIGSNNDPPAVFGSRVPRWWPRNEFFSWPLKFLQGQMFSRTQRLRLVCRHFASEPFSTKDVDDNNFFDGDFFTGCASRKKKKKKRRRHAQTIHASVDQT